MIQVRFYQGDEVKGEIRWDGKSLETSGLGDKMRFMAQRGDTAAYLRNLPGKLSGVVRAELSDDTTDGNS